MSARRTVLAFAVLASTLLPMFALPARAGDGASYAAVAIAADAQAQAIAVHVAKIAREAIESDPDFRYLSLEEILDWRPFDYFTIERTIPMPVLKTIRITFELEYAPNGTRLTEYSAPQTHT